MPVTTADKRATFRTCTKSGCFVIPNPFDVGSAKALQQLGFKALASTSAGFAWTIGKADNRVTLDEVCAHLTALCAAVDLPVNADFEGGFAHEPDEGRRQCRARGQDRRGRVVDRGFHRRCRKTALRARASRSSASRRRGQAIDADNSGVLLTGRCEGFLVGQADLDMVIDRLKAYSEAGADCLYAPGIKTKEQIVGGGEGRASETGQSSDRRVRSFSRGSRRSRRSPHQRRRFAGARGLGRFHAGSARDRGEGDVHRTRPTVIPVPS